MSCVACGRAEHWPIGCFEMKRYEDAARRPLAPALPIDDDLTDCAAEGCAAIEQVQERIVERVA